MGPKTDTVADSAQKLNEECQHPLIQPLSVNPAGPNKLVDLFKADALKAEHPGELGSVQLHGELLKARILEGFLFSQPGKREESILNGNFPQPLCSKNSR